MIIRNIRNRCLCKHCKGLYTLCKGTLHLAGQLFSGKDNFSNPGTMLVSVEDFFEGGHSICRNSALHKMFEMIGGGERAGSGADTIKK